MMNGVGERVGVGEIANVGGGGSVAGTLVPSNFSSG